MARKVGLIILDGWGIGDHGKGDAVFQAKTPVMDRLIDEFPNAQLLTSGEHVGLPDGQMGNSEVGHLNIGAGRIVYQELTRINLSIRNKDFFKNQVLTAAFKKASESGQRVHYIGLVSEGGVHSSQKHLYALCEMAQSFGIKEHYIHAFTDGRDCDPKSGLGFIHELESAVADTGAKVVSVIGRYYVMDRDKRWERVKVAYDLLVHGKGERFDAAADAINHFYNQDITDEFIPAVSIHGSDQEAVCIKNGDLVVSFNFRTDRPREISMALTQKSFEEFEMSPIQLDYVTMTSYDDTFHNVQVVFEKDNLSKTLGEVVALAGKKQVRIAETEKYPHVTFFFSGGREEPFEGESRILINSPKVATYDLQPEMSAPEVCDKMIDCLHKERPDFFCLNFANADMVGHTGVFPAIVKAVETVDRCLEAILECGEELSYEFFIIADHGNADYAINPDGTPNTAHSLNPVPVIFVSKEREVKISDGILADVAPSILERMRLEKPEEMTGKSLLYVSL